MITAIWRLLLTWVMTEQCRAMADYATLYQDSWPHDIDAALYKRIQGLSNPCFESPDRSFCLPSAYIVGLPKAGTSALWHKLSHHPSVQTAPNRKEYCPADNWPSLSNVLDWAQQFSAPGDLAATDLILNGCLSFGGVRGRRYFALLQHWFNVTDYKIVLLLRNYPDWLYAGYQYWCYPGLGDLQCTEPDFFAIPGVHERSRQAFHSLVLQPDASAKLPYLGDNYLYKHFVENLTAAVGRHRVLLLRQEGVSEQPLRTLRTIERFMGLDAAQYDRVVLSAVVNHRSAKGWDAVLLGETTAQAQAAAYPGQPGSAARAAVVAETRDNAAVNDTASTAAVTAAGASNNSHVGSTAWMDMLPETRRLLDDRWRSDCEYLWEEWGLCFASCCKEGALLQEQGSQEVSAQAKAGGRVPRRLYQRGWKRMRVDVH